MNIDRVKLSILVWIAVYPVATALASVSAYALTDMPLAVRTLVTSAIMVPAMTFVIIPNLLQVFGDWLTTPIAQPPRQDDTQRKLEAWFEEMAACPN